MYFRRITFKVFKSYVIDLILSTGFMCIRLFTFPKLITVLVSW